VRTHPDAIPLKGKDGPVTVTLGKAAEADKNPEEDACPNDDMGEVNPFRELGDDGTRKGLDDILVNVPSMSVHVQGGDVLP
jgi:hypothetical protein